MAEWQEDHTPNYRTRGVPLTGGWVGPQKPSEYPPGELRPLSPRSDRPRPPLPPILCLFGPLCVSLCLSLSPCFCLCPCRSVSLHVYLCPSVSVCARLCLSVPVRFRFLPAPVSPEKESPSPRFLPRRCLLLRAPAVGFRRRSLGDPSGGLAPLIGRFPRVHRCVPVVNCRLSLYPHS